MSPGASLGRFKINLQRNGDETDPTAVARMNNSTLGNKGAQSKLLPAVNQTGSPSQKRQAY